MKRVVLFVPGLGSKAGEEDSDGIHCRVIKFDYRYTTKAIIDFFTDNYTFLTTDRVKRLEDQIKSLYEPNHKLFIIAHSHGALLTHNALKNLGKKYGVDYTNGITVATFGPAKAIATCHKNYKLKDATNVFFDRDWILKRFKNKPFSKLPLNKTVTIPYNNCQFNVLIKSTEDDIYCSSGDSMSDKMETHRCYFNELIPNQERSFCEST